MVLELSFSLRHNISPGDPKRADQPEKKEDDLNPADDRESREKSHGAPNEAELGLKLDPLVSLDLVEGGRVKVDLDHLQSGLGHLVSWKGIVEWIVITH